MPANTAAEWFDLGDDATLTLGRAAALVSADAGLSAWLDEGRRALVAALGRPSEQRELARLVSSAVPDAESWLRQYLPLVLLADGLPAAVAFMRQRGIDDDVIRASLADVGRTEAKNRRWFDRAGLDGELAVWLTHHLHGSIYQLGRLQFERVRVSEQLAAVLDGAGGTAEAGDVVLSVHIPAGLGPMSSDAVDESVAVATRFFPMHFPEERPRAAVCISWLLDPQLADHLPESSNIVRFQRRFALGPVDHSHGPSDEVVRRFVFGEARTPLADQPRSSTLERAIHAHLDGGGHFWTRSGWFPIGDE